jgi:hypothetical protein
MSSQPTTEQFREVLRRLAAFGIAVKDLIGTALLFACLLLSVGCASAPPQASSPGPSGTKARWHSIKVVPGTNAPVVHTWNKFNPIWWAQNASEPDAPAWYCPDCSCREFRWWLRNPFSNFTSYVIGVADKETVRYGRYPEQTSNPKGGWNFAVTRRRIVYLPFIDYKRARFEFYFGWRKAGKFGVKLNFHQRVLPPATPAADAATRRHSFFIWDQCIDLDSRAGAPAGRTAPETPSPPE